MTPSDVNWTRLLKAIDVEDASVGQVAEALEDARGIANDEAYQVVEDAIDAGDLVEDLDAGMFGAVRLPEPDDSEGCTDDVEREPSAEPETDAVGREDAVDALRDVLRFYNSKVDAEIGDHTDAGEHPERPTTAREYFTEVRGWDDETVDDLLLGWAPPDHKDELVAYLFERGHSREAMLATGALGEYESGGLYVTFPGRYVFPYYDADGEPAYAIARCTGGLGGGDAGYAGHPRDYQSGKYAKLRHTDVRVPFDEPIYGLDTLEDAEHVVVAEGIADAISAREQGYAVLSPVAKEFKEAHYAPLVDALTEHHIERVTIVADNDDLRHDDAGSADPGSIAGAIDSSLMPVGPGLAGALRTATKVGARTDVDIRVAVPPAPADLDNDLDDYVTGDWNGDLEALLRSAKPADEYAEYDQAVADTSGRRAGGRGHTGGEFDAEIDVDPADEAPEEMPACYAAALEARSKPSETGYATDHDLNLLVANLGVYAGYETETLVEQFREHPLHDNSDKFDANITRTAIKRTREKIENGDLAPPSEGTLRDKRILEGSCGCPAHTRDRDADEEYRQDPRDLEATVDARRAWDAASRVSPGDVDEGLPDAPDVVRAVAIAEGFVDTVDEPLDEEYPRAYQIAREEYGAPLPEYYTEADAIAKFDAVLDVLGEITFWHLNADALESEITAEDDDVDGKAVRALNPSWRESESYESILVFGSGNVWDADSGRTLDAVRLAALDSGLIDDPAAPVEGELFTESYRRLRDEYGAPLPRWDPANTGDGRDITPQLPPSEELLGKREFDGVDPDALEAARKEVEAVIGDAVESDEPTVVTSLPATGKTTGTIKTARENPLAYLAPRKELQQQALEKAERWGVGAEVLPVFSEERVRADVLDAAVSHVREEGKARLRDRWAILSTAVETAGDKDDEIDVGEIFVEEDEDEDEVDLERPTCPTAEGEHGVAWALAVHVARRLGYTPREIHTQARGLFGTELPCGDGCDYSAGWDRVTDADAPVDLLIGSYVHAHVPSVSRYIYRDEDGTVESDERPLVIDEFVGEAFATEYGNEALDFATWLASNLREDVDDRRDMFTADLEGDEFVLAWLDGDASDTEGIGDAITTLARFDELFDAREAAEEILESADDELLEEFDVRDPLRTLAVDDEPVAALRDLGEAIADADPHHPAAGLVDWIDDAVRDPLAAAVRDGTEPAADGLGELPVDGDLADLVDDTVEAVHEGGEHAKELVAAATTALQGGRDGCRRLAAWADDGYAHPNAHHLLNAVITPTGDEEDADRVETDTWAFDPDATDGTIVDVVDTGAKARTLLDRNDHGAILHTPPAADVPIVGLDATGRESLWSVALQEDVRVDDIHDTARERAEFLENVLDLRVIQAADRPRFYEGDPASKDTDADVALLEAIADEYAGIDAPRERGEEAVTVGKPAAITTKGVRDLLEDDERLDDVVAAWENYGNVTGANDLGDHRLAALLGCQHYGDDAIERFAALDGREIDTSRDAGRGSRLEYGDELADDYLAHMTEDQTMQAILRFARGDSGATVVARTSTLREDLPVVGEGQVVETWSDAATSVARAWRRLDDEFTVADVREVAEVDVSKRHVRRVLSELVEAGYLQRLESGEGRATIYGAGEDVPAGEVELPERREAVDSGEPGPTATNQYYTWNVRVSRRSGPLERRGSTAITPDVRAPPSPTGRGQQKGGDRASTETK